MDNDIVAVFPFKSSQRQDAHCFGIIKSFDASTNRFKVEVMLARESAFHADMSEALRQQPKLKILRIDSILSTLRELDAIAQLGKHQLLPCILRGEFAPMRELTQAERMLIQSQVQRFRQLNESQRQALKYRPLPCPPPASILCRQALHPDSQLTFIQGPPGSGKSHLIKCMVGAFLTPRGLEGLRSGSILSLFMSIFLSLLRLS